MKFQGKIACRRGVFSNEFGTLFKFINVYKYYLTKGHLSTNLIMSGSSAIVIPEALQKLNAHIVPADRFLDE